MKRLLLIAALLISAQGFAQKKAPTSYDLVIGTYTKGASKGIYVYRFYSETGKLAYLSQADGVSNPSYLCISKDNHFIYSVNEDGKDGGVSSFTFEPNVGTMKLLNRESSKGADPCYISVDEDRKNVFVANYSSGSLAVLPVNKDGSLAPASQVIQDEGKGPDASRQEGPHVHTAYFSPDEKYLLYTDLGTDKVNITRYHASAARPLTPEGSVSVKPGNGPRHMVFSPDHKYLYLLQEMGSAINVYSYGGGKLKELQTVSMKQPQFKGTNGAAAIKIAPDGHFLYATDRLDASSILVYAINPQDGKLTFMERHNTGKNPRDFAIDPTGKWLLVANQDSDNIMVFSINPGTGSLSTTGINIQIGNPVCLKFTAAE
ncbi:MAG TPA: lactonase family protein [Mucilaginibacter sp.]|jgi:6-phosphogluconolactonase|nr:lactonase family protein [Mucilaginibacter sp.]